jgi:hypothetical protein
MSNWVRVGRAGGSRFAILLVYLLAGALGGVLHARETADAPVRIESTHHEQCPVLHDPSVCVVCSGAHAQALAGRGYAVAVAGSPMSVIAPWTPRRIPATRVELLRSPRGPPLLLA